ncbi:hypothetical protein BG261_07965 [Floricoccus tropicus]|uniref:Uncharacterized protein n=1 Tax=Floricoccus tropicus TaxID=1859473 RepID=A0A1E8GIZ5_9LACT|nr:PRD domain-containing protein [Floricoccus tropicus]OFI48209.1 hypothetical protein BG261_07965 [Floricoccus tropicus]
MIITVREQKLIDAFKKKKKVLKIEDMLAITGTSRRTLYRDLQNLQDSLAEYDIILQRTDEGYLLSGNLKALDDLNSQKEWRAQDRLLAELLILIKGRTSLTELMDYFGASQPTISNDLQAIEKELTYNSAELSRKNGLSIIASEFTKRSIMVGVLSKVLKPFEIFNLTEKKLEKNQVANLIDYSVYDKVNRAFQGIDFKDFSDKTQAIWRLFFVASLVDDNEIEESNVQPSKASLNKTKKIIEKMDEVISEKEIAYLSNIADILHFERGASFLFTEKFDTDFSYRISKFINLMSEKLQIDFERDEKLFDLLNAHLRSTMLLPSFFDRSDDVSMIKEIESSNQKIFAAVDELLNEVFEKKFSKKEVAYITLHFVSTLERSDSVLPLVAALITSNGFVTTEIVSRSIKTQFPFIKDISIIQSSQMGQIDFSGFDVIFSTDNLEVDFDYIKLGEMLSRQNIDYISKELRKIQQKVSGRRIQRRTSRNFVNIQEFFKVSSEILENFKISNLENKKDFQSLVANVTSAIDEDTVTDKKKVGKVIANRFVRTPFGIPETKMALFHAVSDNILRPDFEIFNLETEVELLGMDKKKMPVSRILLLIAPEDSDEVVSYLLGKISSSIIENKLYTTIYNSGNYDVIYQLLNQIITDGLKEYEV